MERILVAEDDADLRELIEVALQEDSYEVRGVGDGCSALDELTRFTPDLVLVDLGLPHLSGHDVLRHLRDQLPFGRVPVIAISGKFTFEALPTKWFLAKPLDLDLMLRVVGELCGRRLPAPFWVQQPETARRREGVAFRP